jgi:Zn-dependent peptidase ImmA (M78 family)
MGSQSSIPARPEAHFNRFEPPGNKARWSEGHEIIHSVLPRHEDTTFGDNKGTLTPACYEELEWEANYGAGQLLFLHKHFKENSDDLALNLQSFQNLGKQYGNSLTTTIQWTHSKISAKHTSLLLSRKDNSS